MSGVQSIEMFFGKLINWSLRAMSHSFPMLWSFMKCYFEIFYYMRIYIFSRGILSYLLRNSRNSEKNIRDVIVLIGIYWKITREEFEKLYVCKYIVNHCSFSITISTMIYKYHMKGFKIISLFIFKVKIIL